MNYRLFLMEPKHVYPQLFAKGTAPEWVVAEWQPNMSDGGMWCEIEWWLWLSFAGAVPHRGWPSWFTGTDPKSPTPRPPPTAPAEGPNGPGWSPLFPQRPTCFFTSPRRGLLIPARGPKMASDRKVHALGPNRGYFP